MLNYLGPNIGAGGPISTQLPPATPGTMPQSVPGVPPVNAPIPTPPIHAAVRGRHPAAAHALAAIINHVATHGMSAEPPRPPDYGTTTQQDGSILLHLKNPDGSLGPVVKLIPPLKRAA